MLKNRVKHCFFAQMLKMIKSLSYCLILTFLITIGCKQPQSFSYRDLRSFKLELLGFDEANATMELVFFNPNKYGVNLKNVNCELYVDSMYLGHLLLDTSLNIPASSEFILPTSIKINPKSLISNDLSFLSNNEISISAKGSTKIGKGGFYVTIPFTYHGKQRLNLF